MKYDVTIGIPVYKAEHYIQRTLESALAQSYPSIEFLIVDDCGDDNSIRIVNAIKNNYSRGSDIRVMTQPVNMGVAAARNRIIDEAQGEYLFFLDSDDIISADAISLLMENVLRYDAEVVFGSYEKKEISGKRVVYQYPNLQFLGKDTLAIFAYRKYAGIQASACNYLVKVSLLRQSNHHFIEARYWEDFAFTFDLVPLVSRAVMLSDITYSYLCRENSLSNYQRRLSVPKSEFINNMKVISHLKETSFKLTERPCFPQRCQCIMMTDFYIACHILKRRSDISPSFSNQEIRAIFRYPPTFRHLLFSRQLWLKNCFFYLLGKMPSSLSVFVIWCIGKIKKII
jgi:glycosyltransferase involved in cell wall biosynthesis